MTGRSPTTSKPESSAKDFRSKCSTCWEQATPSCPASCAAGCAGEDLATSRDLGQRLRRVRGVAAPLLAGISDLDRAEAFPRSRQPGAGAAQGRRAEPHPLGDDAPPRDPASDGARHRSSHSAGGSGGGRGGAGAHSRFQGAGGPGGATRRRRASRLRHAARRQIWPRRAVRRRRRDRTCGWRGRSNCPVRSAAAVRVQPGSRQPADRMAGGSLRQGVVLLPSGRRRGAQGASRPPSSFRPSRPPARSDARS